MADPNQEIQIELTPEQQAEVEKITGRKSDTLRFNVRELEERIAPTKYPQIG